MRKLIKRMQSGGYAELLSKLGTSGNSGVLQSPKVFSINNPISIPTPSFDSETDNGKVHLNGKVPLDFNAMGNLFKTANSLLPKTENSNTFNAISGGIDTLGSAVGQINPVAGAIIEGAGVGLNAVNSLFGKKTSKFSKNSAAFSLLGGSYSGSNAIADKASTDQNTKYGLFSGRARKSAENNIQNAKVQQNTINDIYETSSNNNALISNQSDRLYTKYNLQLQGGLNPIHIGKKGLKFPTKDERAKINNIINYRKPEEPKEDPTLYTTPEDYLFSNKSLYHNPIQQGGELYIGNDGKTHFNPSEYQKLIYSKEQYEQYLQENNKDILLDYEIPEFKDGGKINVIPDGALHARLNHIDNEDITKKGIPVVTEQDGGLVQQAEVEKNEIIFHKEVTEELERLCKDGSKQSAIDAGKLIAEQIMENTRDNTGLLNQIE